MYYILYGFLYLLSLLPFSIIYLLSDGISGLLYHVIKYRRDVVRKNLKIAFPEKDDKEIEKISRQFYRNFCDTFLESIKLLSMSDAEVEKRVLFDPTIINELSKQGKNIQIHSGHQFNWEYGNMIFPKKIIAPFVGVYMPIKSKPIDRLFIKLRSRFKTVLVPVPDFRVRFKEVSKSRYSLGLLADQNAHPAKAHWLYFFGKPAPFVSGPDKGGRANGTAVVFVCCKRRGKRGFYEYTSKFITEDARSLKEGELTRMFRDYMEECIREQPDNYLWSHKRWRKSYKAEYERRWVDKVPPPQL